MRKGMPDLVLVLVTLLTWAGTVHGGFVNRDTPWLVVDNPILSTGSLSEVPAILWGMDVGTRMTLGAEFLPIRDLTVLLDFALWGDWLWGHHLQNLGWYTLGCWLFYRMLVRLFGGGTSVLVVAVVFAVLPAHAENVAWLAGRKDVVSMAFFFGGLWAASTQRGLWLAALCFPLAVWSKNTTITMPAVALLIWWFQRRSWKEWRLVLGLMGAVALMALMVSLSLGKQVGMMAPERTQGMADLVILQGRLLLAYAEMLVWPGSLKVLHPEPSLLPWTQPMNLLGMGLYAGLLGVALLGLKTRRAWTLGVVWFFVTLLPTFALVPIQNLLADRYLLLPSAGLVMLMAGAARPLVAGVGLLVPVLMVVSWQQSRVWRDSVVLWQDAVEDAPEVPEVWTALGGALMVEGQPQQANQILREAVLRFPEDASVHSSLGAHLMKVGNSGEAEGVLDHALALDPEDRKALNNKLALLNGQGRNKEGLKLAQRLTQVHANYAVGWNTAGVCWMTTDPVRAVQAFEQALVIDPYAVSPVCNLGVLLAAMGSGDAEPRLHRCLTLNPGDHQAQQVLERIR